MQKISSIYIGGVQLICEELAYQDLEEYLASIALKFKDDPEILEDIEARLAEQLSKGLNSKNSVVTVQDVKAARKIMGDAEDFEENQTEKTPTKKLYRDLEHGLIGGVFAGLASYYRLAPWTLRAIFIGFLVWLHIFVAIFVDRFHAEAWSAFYFALLTAYCLSWIFIPPAKNLSQKLELRGWPSTLEKMRELVNFSKKESSKRHPEKTTPVQNFLNEFARILEDLFLKLRGLFAPMSVKLKTICRVFLGLLLTLSSFFGIAGVIITGAVFIFSPDAIFELIQNTFTIHSSNASVEALAIQEFLTELIKDTAFANLLWSAGIAFLVPLSFGFMGGISLLRQKSIFRLSPSLVFLLIWILSIAGIGVFGIQLAPKIQEFVLQSQEGLIWIH